MIIRTILPARTAAALGAVATMAVALPAPAAEIVLYPSAIDAALKREVFNRNGRAVLSGDPRTCAYATLDSPQSAFRNGRLVLRARFVQSAAALVNNRCVGGGDTFWVTVSAEPYFAGDVLSLRNARVEEAEPIYRPLVEIFVATFAPRALSIDLREEIAKMLRNARTPYDVTVPAIDVQSILAAEDRLQVKFDFRLEAR